VNLKNKILKKSRRLPKVLIQNNRTKGKSKIELKDIIIPLASAVFAVSINQIFFEQNRKVEAQIEYERETLKEQTPALNRILAFTYRYETMVIKTVLRRSIIVYCIDPKTMDTIDLEEKNVSYGDTTKVSAPSFILVKTKRERLLSDLEAVKKYRDILDHEIYIALENVFIFLEDNPMPNMDDSEDVANSVWRKKEVQKKWEDMLYELRVKCVLRIEKFKIWDM
jgi:hypothetical protein